MFLRIYEKVWLLLRPVFWIGGAQKAHDRMLKIMKWLDEH